MLRSMLASGRDCMLWRSQLVLWGCPRVRRRVWLQVWVVVVKDVGWDELGVRKSEQTVVSWVWVGCRGKGGRHRALALK